MLSDPHINNQPTAQGISGIPQTGESVSAQPKQATEWSGRTINVLEAFVDEVLGQAGIVPKNQLLLQVIDDIFERAGITPQKGPTAEAPVTSRVITQASEKAPIPKKINTVGQLIKKFETTGPKNLAPTETKQQQNTTQVSSAKAKYEALVDQTVSVDSKSMLAIREMATTGKTTRLERLMTQSQHGFHKDLRAELQKVSDTLQTQNPHSIEAKFVLQLLASYDVVASFDYEKHKLNPLEMIKISACALQKLEKSSDSIQYITKAQSGLSRDIVIEKDGNTRSFSILSKKEGELHAEGTFKKVTDAVTVGLKYAAENHKLESTVPMHDVRAVNKSGMEIDGYELKMEMRFGDNSRTVSHTSKKGETKTSLLQPQYDGDLSKVKLPTTGAVASVFTQAGKGLAKMHAEGCSHFDLKVENLLAKKTTDGSIPQYKARVADFGAVKDTKSSDTKYNRCINGGYGTASFTAPEQVKFILDRPGNKRVIANRERQGIANADERHKAYAREDMYALGCALFETLLKESITWGGDAHNAIVGDEGDRDPEDCRSTLAMQHATPDILRAEAAKLTGGKKALLEICAKLLEADPEKRMTITEFVSEMEKLDPEEELELTFDNDTITDQISEIYKPQEALVSKSDSPASSDTSAPTTPTLMNTGSTVYTQNTGSTVYTT